MLVFYTCLINQTPHAWWVFTLCLLIWKEYTSVVKYFINVLLYGYLLANWLTFAKNHSSQWQLRCVFFSRAYLESEVAISEELVQKYSNSALGHVNCTIKELRRLFLVDDLVDSLKVSLFAFHFLTYPEFNIRVKRVKLCFLY